MSKSIRNNTFMGYNDSTILGTGTNYNPNERIKGNIEFDKQLERNMELEYDPEPSPIRNIDVIPKISTKCKGGQLIGMEAMMKRDNIFINKGRNLQYNPKMNLVYERTPRGLIKFAPPFSPVAYHPN